MWPNIVTVCCFFSFLQMWVWWISSWGAAGWMDDGWRMNCLLLARENNLCSRRLFFRDFPAWVWGLGSWWLNVSSLLSGPTLSLLAYEIDSLCIAILISRLSCGRLGSTGSPALMLWAVETERRQWLSRRPSSSRRAAQMDYPQTAVTKAAHLLIWLHISGDILCLGLLPIPMGVRLGYEPLIKPFCCWIKVPWNINLISQHCVHICCTLGSGGWADCKVCELCCIYPPPNLMLKGQEAEISNRHRNRWLAGCMWLRSQTREGSGERVRRCQARRWPAARIWSDGQRREKPNLVWKSGHSVRSESWEVRRKKSAGSLYVNTKILLKKKKKGCLIRQAVHKRSRCFSHHIRLKHLEMKQRALGWITIIIPAAANLISLM